MSVQTVDLGVVVGPRGYSPSAVVSKTGNVVTIRLVDVNGTTTATVNDVLSVNGVSYVNGAVVITGADINVSGAAGAVKLDAALAQKQPMLSAANPLPIASGGTGVSSLTGLKEVLDLNVTAVTNAQIDAILAS